MWLPVRFSSGTAGAIGQWGLPLVLSALENNQRWQVAAAVSLALKTTPQCCTCHGVQQPQGIELGQQHLHDSGIECMLTLACHHNTAHNLHV